MRVLRLLAFLPVLGALAVSDSGAQTARKAPLKAPAISHPEERERANENLLMVLGGSVGGAYLQLAQDVAAAVSGTDDSLRVLAIAGDGAVGNVRDVLLLRGVDLGITTVQTLDALKASGANGPNLDQRITYVAPLSVDMFHVVTRPEYNSLKDLQGKKVHVLQKGSSTAVFGSKILKAFGVEIEEVNAGHDDGVRLFADGKFDATLCLCATPVPSIAALQPKFKLLEVPLIPALEETYIPASVSSTHYPNLVAAGSSVQTIGTSTVLITYNWPPGSERYRKIERFVNAFFSNLDKLRRPPHHPTWKEINIGANMRGWRRFPAAQQWLDRQAAEAKAREPPPGDASQARTQAAKAAPFDQAEQDRLFKEFLEWSRKRPRQ